MNERKKSKPPSIGEVFGDNGAPDRDPKGDKIAELEQRVGSLENRLYEERFIWALVVIILFDFLLFPTLSNWAGPIVIGVLQLIGLFVLAERCKVDAILPLIDRIGGAVKNFKKDNG